MLQDALLWYLDPDRGIHTVTSLFVVSVVVLVAAVVAFVVVAVSFVVAVVAFVVATVAFVVATVVSVVAFVVAAVVAADVSVVVTETPSVIISAYVADSPVSVKIGSSYGSAGVLSQPPILHTKSSKHKIAAIDTAFFIPFLRKIKKCAAETAHRKTQLRTVATQSFPNGMLTKHTFLPMVNVRRLVLY